MKTKLIWCLPITVLIISISSAIYSYKGIEATEAKLRIMCHEVEPTATFDRPFWSNRAKCLYEGKDIFLLE